MLRIDETLIRVSTRATAVSAVSDRVMTPIFAVDAAEFQPTRPQTAITFMRVSTWSTTSEVSTRAAPQAEVRGERTMVSTRAPADKDRDAI